MCGLSFSVEFHGKTLSEKMDMSVHYQCWKGSQPFFFTCSWCHLWDLHCASCVCVCLCLCVCDFCMTMWNHFEYISIVKWFAMHSYYILTLDQAVNQRCTCVNKQKKKQKQVGIMKGRCRQQLRELETGRPEWGPAYRLRAVTLNDSWSSNPSQDAEEVLSGFLKITRRAMVKRRSWVNIAVCPCLHSSLTHHRNFNPFMNKVWGIYFYKEVCFVRHYLWLCFRLYLYMYVGIQQFIEIIFNAFLY